MNPLVELINLRKLNVVCRKISLISRLRDIILIFQVQFLATMLNDEKSQELLLLYIEEIPKNKMEKLFLNGKLLDSEWEKEKPELKKRGLSVISIL